MNIFKFMQPESMVKEQFRVGELPDAKTAYKTSINMAWPSAVESVLIALIASVDTMMVGKLGSAAISAVGITTQPKFILLAIIITLNMGVTAVVARRKGAGDYAGARRCLKQALIICISLAAVLNVLGEIFAKPLLELAGAKPDYIDDAVMYFKIILIGNFFSCISLTINAAQRGFGNTRISMITNTTANLVNVLFNFLLINGIWIFPQLGVKGAAIATTIGNFVGLVVAVVSAIMANRDGICLVTPDSWRFDKVTMSSVGKVWSSALVEQIFLRIGFFVYAAMVASLGTLEFASHQICMQMIHISFAFGDGLAIASTSLVGQSLGKQRPDLAIMYGKVGQRCALISGIFLFVAFVIFRRPLVMLFTDEEPVIKLASIIMLILAATCLAQTSQVVISGCLRGAGDTKFVAFSSFICIGIVRTIFSYLLCYPLGLGLVGAWLGLFTDQFLRLVINFWRFGTGKWTRIKL